MMSITWSTEEGHRLKLHKCRVGGYFVWLIIGSQGVLVANSLPHKNEEVAFGYLTRVADRWIRHANYEDPDDIAFLVAQRVVQVYKWGFRPEILEGLILSSSSASPKSVRVFEALVKVPRGMVTTYSELARFCGIPHPRGVARILASNPFPLLIPCHKVVYNDGKLGGYLGSSAYSWLKAELLAKEGVIVQGGRVPRRCIFRFRRIC